MVASRLSAEAILFVEVLDFASTGSATQPAVSVSLRATVPQAVWQSVSGMFSPERIGTIIDNAVAEALILLEVKAAESDIVQAQEALDANTDADVGSETNESSGIFPLVPVIVGAVGGAILLLLIIIAIGVFHKRARGPVAPKASEREVVAFNNPMYDGPGGGAMPMQDEDGGLYLETKTASGLRRETPTAKVNPMCAPAVLCRPPLSPSRSCFLGSAKHPNFLGNAVIGWFVNSPG